MFRRGEAEERHDQRHDQRPIEPREVRMKEGEVTVVGQGARLEGSLVSAGSLRIDGQVKGKITAEGDVSLAPQSQVEADIQAQNVTVAGKFRGDITVRSKAELARGGRVEGNITSKTLVVAEGATFTGQSIMDQQAARQGQAQPAPERRGGAPDTVTREQSPDRPRQPEGQRAPAG